MIVSGGIAIREVVEGKASGRSIGKSLAAIPKGVINEGARNLVQAIPSQRLQKLAIGYVSSKIISRELDSLISKYDKNPSSEKLLGIKQAHQNYMNATGKGYKGFVDFIINNGENNHAQKTSNFTVSAQSEILGVDVTKVSEQTVKFAWRKLMRQHHPDQNGGTTNSKFFKVQQAYESYKEYSAYRQTNLTSFASDGIKGLDSTIKAQRVVDSRVAQLEAQGVKPMVHQGNGYKILEYVELPLFLGCFQRLRA